MQCPDILEIDLADWGGSLNTKLKGQRYPYSATFEVTDRCNFACVHCYINQPVGSKPTRSVELTTAQVKGILDQMAAAGTLFLTLTGGDPLVRSDFPEIYKHARRLGFVVTLFTNGSLITPEIADLLADYTPRVVEITLYGATPETYDKVTRCPGAYDRAHRGIQLLLDRGIPLSLKTMLLTINRHEFEAMETFAEQLGLKFRYDRMLWPRLDGDMAPNQYQLPIEEVIKVEFRDPDVNKEWHHLANRFTGQATRSDRVFSCAIGRRAYHIDSQGRMSACMSVRRPSYDLLQMSFQEAWEKLGALALLKRQLDTACRTCVLNDICDQCPGWSQAVHGDDETPVDFLCELAHQRAKHLTQLEICYNTTTEEKNANG